MIIALLFAIVLSLASNLEAGDSLIEACVWKDGHKGAVSFSIDDANLTCGFKFLIHGCRGTYYITGEPKEWKKRSIPLRILYILGNEIGSHTVHHLTEFSAQGIESEFKTNINDIMVNIGIPYEDINTFAWPYGRAQHKHITAEYFLCARGYGMNNLEDPTPKDPMNLRSFMSHEHAPRLRLDLKQVIDQAETQGKWANIVFHTQCNDDGSIKYVKTKDIWVAPIQTTELQKTASKISFKVHRPKIPASRVRSFEDMFREDKRLFWPADEISLKIDIDDARGIKEVTVDKKRVAYKTRNIGGNKYLLLNTYIPIVNKKHIEITYK